MTYRILVFISFEGRAVVGEILRDFHQNPFLQHPEKNPLYLFRVCLNAG
jgi:hypothetical protein